MTRSTTFQIFKSSAGSGKTFTLVKEYFKIILDNPEKFKHTLAITFTNKSTAEMKNRILETAQAIADGKENSIYKEVVKDKPGLKNRNSEAQAVLKKILHNYPQFAISTIDSFFSRIIRSLAYETGIPMQFEIELNNDQIIDKICADLFLDIKDNTALRDWLIEFAKYTIELDKGWNLDRELKTTSKELFKDDYRNIQNERYTDDKQLLSELNKTIAVTEKTAENIGTRFFEFCEKHHIDLDDIYYKKNGILVKFFTYLKSNDLRAPTNSVIKFYNGATAWGRKKSDDEALINSFSTELNAFLEEGMHFYNNQYKDYKTAKAIISNYYASAILNRLDEKYSVYRESNQVLTIGDYMQSLATLIQEDDTPFIYEKVGNRYKHILVDEFQDTSEIQWQNIRPLLINSLSDANSSLIVGDAKQSIYRWRGGNMELLVKRVGQDLAAFKSVTDEVPLHTNYRSHAEIVEFNNRFFDEAKNLLLEANKEQFLDKDLELLSSVYGENSLKQKADKKEGGYVELKILDEEIEPENYSKSREVEELNPYKNQALQYTLNTIKEAVAGGFAYKDICILVRSKSEIELLTHFLLNNGIREIVSADSLFIDEAPSVALILNSLVHLQYPDDDIALSNIIYHLHSISNPDSDFDWNELIEHDEQFKLHINEEIRQQLTTLKNLPLLNLTEELCKLYGIDTVTDQYILKFLDIILAYSKKAESNLSDFLNWYINNDSPSLSQPENQNALQIMTIHKSKGLQFPIVIIPFANWKFKKGGKSPTKWLSTEQKPFNTYQHQIISVSKDTLESHFEDDIKHENALICIDNLNLLYVAFTRAEKKLFIASEKDTGTTLSSAQAIINALVDNQLIDQSLSQNLIKEKTKEDSKPVLNSLSNPFNISISSYPMLNWQSNYSLSITDLQKKNNFGSEEIKFGTYIHDKIADVNSIEELKQLIEQLEQSDDMQNSHFAELVKGLNNLSKDDEAKHWFSDSWTIKNEIDILDANNKPDRPDRVVYNNSDCFVIDYKTGAQNDKHKTQVNHYCAILERMGLKNVRGFILYLSPYFIDKL